MNVYIAVSSARLQCSTLINLIFVKIYFEKLAKSKGQKSRLFLLKYAFLCITKKQDLVNSNQFLIAPKSVYVYLIYVCILMRLLKPSGSVSLLCGLLVESPLQLEHLGACCQLLNYAQS